MPGIKGVQGNSGTPGVPGRDGIPGSKGDRVNIFQYSGRYLLGITNLNIF